MIFLKVALLACLVAVAYCHNYNQLEGLKAHNEYRWKHGVSLLCLNDTLNNLAQDWAITLARTGTGQYRPNNPYGELLHAVSGSSPNPGREATTHWYNQNKQWILRASSQMGMGFARGVYGRIYIVANYSPRGGPNGPTRVAQNVPNPTV